MVVVAMESSNNGGQKPKMVKAMNFHEDNLQQS
jgi:hypothetical protein